MSKNDGGAAFPSEGGRRFVIGNEVRMTLPSDGMTLRDYFAAKAMQAIISYGIENFTQQEGETPGQMAARQAYKAADAMLAERKREQ